MAAPPHLLLHRCLCAGRLLLQVVPFASHGFSVPLQELPPRIFINDDEYIDNDDNFREDRESALQTEQGSAASLKSICTASTGSFRLAGREDVSALLQLIQSSLCEPLRLV
jgi:hypothetical protein